MDISREIKIMLAASGKTQTDLAEMLNTSQSCIAGRLKNNVWRLNDFIKIADLLGYEVKVSIKEKAKS